MRAILVIVIAAAIVYFLVRGQPAGPHSAGATPAPEHAEPVRPIPIPIPAITPGPAIATQPVGQTTALYKQLFRPAYFSLIDATVKYTDLRNMNAEAADLRVLLSTVPASPEHDAALRLCAIIDQAATLTRSVVRRKDQSSPLDQPPASSKRSGEAARAAKETEERNTFFSQAAENSWRAQIAPMQAAARSEWGRIPDNAILSSSSLPAYAAARAQRLRQRQ